MSALSPARIPPVVVITGASAGIGRATAHLFARKGARIGLIGRDEAGLEDTRREVDELGGEGVVLKGDVANAEEVDAAAEHMAARFGGIHIWVNNAMVTVYSPVEKLTPDEIRRVTDVTYLGTVHGTLAALRHMRRQGHGTIVQVGSALAFRGIPLQAAYCGAKHAVEGFTDSLRTELIGEKSRIRITSVHLPAINTPQFSWARTHTGRQPAPVGPVFSPEVAARAIVKAAFHPRRSYWLGGPTTASILGNMIAPGLADRYLARTAHDGQQTDEAAMPGRPDNLFEPGGEHRVHGRFLVGSRDHAMLVTPCLPKSVAVLALGGAALAMGFVAGFIARPRIRRRQFEHRARRAVGRDWMSRIADHLPRRTWSRS